MIQKAYPRRTRPSLFAENMFAKLFKVGNVDHAIHMGHLLPSFLDAFLVLVRIRLKLGGKGRVDSANMLIGPEIRLQGFRS